MGQRRRQRRRAKGQARPPLLRRLGRIGAALAIAVQLLLPIIAMPPAALAAADAATTQDASILAQASAAWGSVPICDPGSGSSHEGKQTPPLVHSCPICWAVQQAASLLPPSLPPIPWAPTLVWVKAPLVAEHPALRRNLSPTQPRGPPLV